MPPALSPAPSRPLSLALPYLVPHRGRLALLGLVLVASTAVAVAAPQLLRRFVDRAADGAQTGTLLWAAAAFAGLALLAEALLVLGDALAARVAWSATNALRLDLVRHCLRLDLTFTQRHPPGALVDRIDGDVGRLANLFSRMVPLLVANGLLLLGIGVALLATDWRVALGYVPLVGGGVVLLRRLTRGAVPAATAQRAASAALLGRVAEHVDGLPDLRGAGANDVARRAFWRDAAALLTVARHAITLGVRWPAAAQGLASAGLLLALLAGAALHLGGHLSLGGAYVLIAYAGMLQLPLLHIAHQAHDLQQALGAWQRVAELLAERPSVLDGPGRLPRPAGGALGVALEEVTFRYAPGERPALDGVTLRLAPGRRLALLGRTGSGKSTLAGLLFRFADPTSGRVLLDGHDLRGLSGDSVRRRVGLVPQEVRIFHATVRDNVSLFDARMSDRQIRVAVREVGLGGWLDALPDGLSTRLGAGGRPLSEGEAQLLSLARVLITDPALVVLDEPTSRLSPAGRGALHAATERLLAGRTAVLVAHQLDTVRTADEVAVLADGRLVEHGPRAALLDDPDSEFSRRLAAGELTR
ncbi:MULTISPECIES: ABC transporter ATP-binding protein [Streptomyces]|nr:MULTISPECIES: ABC transporter ATP-binding protein [Streptomyces]